MTDGWSQLLVAACLLGVVHRSGELQRPDGARALCVVRSSRRYLRTRWATRIAVAGDAERGRARRPARSAMATLRDRGAGNADVRTAGRFQQLAVRTLAAASVKLRAEGAGPTATADSAGHSRHRERGWQSSHPDRPTADAAEVAHHHAAPPREVARLLPGGATSHRRAMELPGGDPSGRDTDGPDPRCKHGRRPGANAVHPLDVGLVRRRRGHQQPTKDAILAAARLLRANGAPGGVADALWHYNPADRYVRAVPSMPARCSARPPSIAATGTGGCYTATPGERMCCPSAIRTGSRCSWRSTSLVR